MGARNGRGLKTNRPLFFGRGGGGGGGGVPSPTPPGCWWASYAWWEPQKVALLTFSCLSAQTFMEIRGTPESCPEKGMSLPDLFHQGLRFEYREPIEHRTPRSKNKLPPPLPPPHPASLRAPQAMAPGAAAETAAGAALAAALVEVRPVPHVAWPKLIHPIPTKRQAKIPPNVHFSLIGALDW